MVNLLIGSDRYKLSWSICLEWFIVLAILWLLEVVEFIQTDINKELTGWFQNYFQTQRHFYLPSFSIFQVFYAKNYDAYFDVTSHFAQQDF